LHVGRFRRRLPGDALRQVDVERPLPWLNRPCAWQLIFTRLKGIGHLDRLDEIVQPKDWSTAWHAGARKIVRKEHRV
jgi:hypothetical protein